MLPMVADKIILLCYNEDTTEIKLLKKIILKEFLL